MKQKVAYTLKSDIKEAVSDLCTQLENPLSSYQLIIFFASSVYNFSELSKELTKTFPSSEVVGVSSAGEITDQGFSKRGILLTTMSDEHTLVNGVILDHLNSFPIIHKQEIEDALEKSKIDVNEPGFEQHSFALSFVNGLLNLEEIFLSSFYAIVGNPKFPLIGASAGDDYRFYKTSLSLNGTISADGAVILFINTNKRFKFYKQIMYKPTGKKLKVTKSNIENRTILEINNKPPLTAYAEVLGVPSTTLMNTILDHPLGMRYGEDIYVTSLEGFNQDRTLKMRTRVFPNTTLDILEPDDVSTVCTNCCEQIERDFSSPGFVLLFVCICSIMGLEKHNLYKIVDTIYNQHFESYCGFATCGEQKNQIHMSQSTLVLVIEE